jgi:hypothetical protein
MGTNGGISSERRLIGTTNRRIIHISDHTCMTTQGCPKTTTIIKQEKLTITIYPPEAGQTLTHTHSLDKALIQLLLVLNG